MPRNTKNVRESISGSNFRVSAISVNLSLVYTAPLETNVTLIFPDRLVNFTGKLVGN